MPASKKPRKKHQNKVTEKGLESWAMFSIRGEGWSDSMLGAFAQDFLLPLDAIYWSKGKDPYCKSLFGRIKDKLVMSWVLGNLLIERDEYRKVIAEANKCLQAAFNCWLDHKKILYPQLKHLRRLAASTFEDLVEYFPPSRISTQRYAMGKGAQYYDAAEDLLDSKLKFKEMNYV